jgi:hypothetical protein
VKEFLLGTMIAAGLFLLGAALGLYPLVGELRPR